MTATATAATDHKKSQHRFRDNVDAFAIAILMAILFKYFAIEAYQIPTSSMQPTMMGSKAAGVFDRILVDKTRYEITDPERWDIAVFRYPIRTRQNYVKRIVGVPEDRLRVAGGNIYQVAPGSDGTDPAALTSLPRPQQVQAQHWKEIFPARMAVQSQTRILDNALSGRGGEWREEDGSLIVKPRSERASAVLGYPGPNDSGLVNLVWDGYPVSVARQIKESPEVLGIQPESIQDVRARFAVTPQSKLNALAVRLAISGRSLPRREFRLDVQDGQGRLVVEEDDKEVLASEPFEARFESGRATAVEFVHLDDHLTASIDGIRVAELDTGAFKTLVAIFPRSSEAGAGATLRIDLKSDREIRVDDLRIDRDLHYLPSMTSQREGTIEVIEVPPDHFFMMGDNTLQSVDSRDWTAITVGRTPEGQLVNPATHPEAERLAGNMRAISLDDYPDPDENPVIVPEERAVVFTDDVGEVWVLEGEVALDAVNGKMWSPQHLLFAGDDGYWEPEQTKVRFVPRSDILGRPLLTFWPLWSPFRLGFIR
jgi:signal peptidase I